MNMHYRTSENVRANAEGQGFSGHASTFWAVDSYWTAMAKGAFRKTIQERGDKILVMWDHDPSRLVGRATDLKEDKDGLYFNARISDTQHGRDLMTLLRDEVPLGVSFSFNTVKSRSATDDDPLDFSQFPNVKRDQVEVITEVKLYELGPVAYPANELADIAAVRAKAQHDHLSAILDAIRSDEPLDAALEAEIGKIVDEYQKRAEAATSTSLTEGIVQVVELDEERKARLNAAIAFAHRIRR